MKITDSNRKAELDFDTIVKDLMNKYGAIFFSDINGSIFIYKALSRKDFKEIVNNDNLSAFEKEDEICSRSVVWPEDIDWDNLEAGIPTKLYSEILKNSFLDDLNSMASLIDVYRSDLETLDTQMSCIISESFPNYDMDEIESWDMIKFTRIFTRAEWKLKNLRNMDTLVDVTEVLKAYDDSNIEEDDEDKYENNSSHSKVKQQSSQKVKVGSREMSAEEYKQYQQFQAMYPDIDFGADAMFTGYDTMTADTISPALRTRK